MCLFLLSKTLCFYIYPTRNTSDLHTIKISDVLIHNIENTSKICFGSNIFNKNRYGQHIRLITDRSCSVVQEAVDCTYFCFQTISMFLP